MPMSPLPNLAVSLAPPPDFIASVVVVVPLSSPQAARKAATAVVLPPTARNLRRETGSLSCLMSAIWRVPPGRLLASTYGEPAPGGSKSVDGERDEGDGTDQRSGAAGAGLDRLGPVRVGACDDAVRRDRVLRGGLPACHVRRPGPGGGDAGRSPAGAGVAAPRRAP